MKRFIIELTLLIEVEVDEQAQKMSSQELKTEKKRTSKEIVKALQRKFVGFWTGMSVVKHIKQK